MRWPIKPRRQYSRWFALWPTQTQDGWVWLEPYYGRDCGLYLERWIDPESHWLTAQVDTLPEGQDAQQGLVRSKGGAVAAGDAPKGGQ